MLEFQSSDTIIVLEQTSFCIRWMSAQGRAGSRAAAMPWILNSAISCDALLLRRHVK